MGDNYTRYDDRNELLKVLPVGIYYVSDELGVCLSEFYMNESAQVWQGLYVNESVKDGVYEDEESGYEDLEFLLETGGIAGDGVFEEFEVLPFYVRAYNTRYTDTMYVELDNEKDGWRKMDWIIGGTLAELGETNFFDTYEDARDFLEKIENPFAKLMQNFSHNDATKYEIVDRVADEVLTTGKVGLGRISYSSPI